MRYFLVILLTFGVYSAPVYATEILCKDRDFNTAISAFDNKASAESWFTPMIYLNPKIMNWVINNDEWFEDQKINKHTENFWRFFEGGVKFEAYYEPQKSRLKIKMFPESGFRDIPFVFYNKCEQVRSAGSLGG